VLSIVLRIKRTLDGAEIDKIVSDVEAGRALAIERRRRAEWRKAELSASRFRAQNVIIVMVWTRSDAGIVNTNDRKVRRRYPAG
jgi:hypothetical protein